MSLEGYMDPNDPGDQEAFEAIGGGNSQSSHTGWTNHNAPTTPSRGLPKAANDSDIGSSIQNISETVQKALANG